MGGGQAGVATTLARHDIDQSKLDQTTTADCASLPHCTTTRLCALPHDGYFCCSCFSPLFFFIFFCFLVGVLLLVVVALGRLLGRRRHSSFLGLKS